MIKRNGAAIRNLLIAVTLVSLIYFVYMYHDTQSRLRHSELVSEKFKRDKDTLSSQLSEINSEKTELRNKFFKDRQDLASQYSESERKYKMLLTQNQNLENEFNRLQQKYEKFSEDTKQKDENRNQEYMQLKQEKDMEIVKLKDMNANILRENEQLKLESIELKKQVEKQQKNNGIGAAAGAGGAVAGAGDAGAGAGGAGAGVGAIGAGAGVVGAGVPDANNNKLNMLHKSINDHMGQANHAGLPDIVPKQPAQLQNFQIQPAHAPNGDGANAGVAAVPDKADESHNVALQNEEILNRQNEGANDHNQVQPPLKDNLNDINESEEDKEILNMLSNRRHKNNKMVEDFKLNNDLNDEGNQPLERINVEDNIAGRELPNDHPRIGLQGHFRGDLKNENKLEKDNAFEHEFPPDGREVQDGRWRNQ